MTLRRFVLIGHPVGHSVSPAIHSAAYRALGFDDCTYEAVDCPDEPAVAEQVEAVRTGRVVGANVTVPWKRVALELSDEPDSAAGETGAANVLSCPRPGTVASCNTDISALERELVSRCPSPSSVAIIGSGGAALASVVAARTLGTREIAVVSRSWNGRTARNEWRGAAEIERLGATPVAWPESHGAASSWTDRVVGSDIVIQATSAGMLGADPGDAVANVVPWDDLRETALAYDVVYNPPVTPFLEAARRRGLPSGGGLGMLVGQAALSLEVWLNCEPPLSEMRAAAEDALFGEASR